MKLRYLAATVAMGTALAAGAVSATSAATAPANTPADVGSSGIPRSLFRQEQLSVVAHVLNTTTTDVQAAHKNKTMAQLISQAGLTKQTFRQQVKAQLTSDLEAKGYSQDQVTLALQHRTIKHMRHHAKHNN